MRIAFDIDGTLIPPPDFAGGSSLAPFPLSLFFREKLRNGAIELLKEISTDHELWIYTTSFRQPFYLKTWFRSLGIKLNCVINQTVHDKAVKSNPSFSDFTKAPKLFNIDLLRTCK